MDEVNIVLGALAAVAAAAASIVFWKRQNIAAHLSPVRRELKKEKAWLRRGEYNAAMVKGRQNLELLLKLVAEFHGIQLDNTAQAVANAKAGPEKNVFLAHRRQGRRVKKVMTHQQFGWWLDANGYLDRVGKWELNEIRLIGNKAVHENYASKEDAWSQYNYLEDVFKLISEKNAGHERKAADAAEKKRNEGAASCEAKKQTVPAAKKETQKNKTKKKEAKQKEPAKPEQPEAGKAKQKKKKQNGGETGSCEEPGSAKEARDGEETGTAKESRTCGEETGRKETGREEAGGAGAGQAQRVGEAAGKKETGEGQTGSGTAGGGRQAGEEDRGGRQAAGETRGGRRKEAPQAAQEETEAAGGGQWRSE